MKTSLSMVGCMLLVLPAAGCAATVYTPGRSAGFVLDPDYEITDKDISRAYQARSQLTAPLRVAFFSFDPRKVREMKKEISRIPDVTAVYSIPSLFITGQRRFAERGHQSNPPSIKPPSIKKMRLLAARAGCNLLLIFDYGYRVHKSPNWLVGFGALIVPILFLPHTEVKVESYLTTYIIDVGNGYLYGQVDAELKGKKRYTNLFSRWSDVAVRKEWSKLLEVTVIRLRGLLAKHLRRPANPAPKAPGNIPRPSEVTGPSSPVRHVEPAGPSKPPRPAASAPQGR